MACTIVCQSIFRLFSCYRGLRIRDASPIRVAHRVWLVIWSRLGAQVAVSVCEVIACLQRTKRQGLPFPAPRSSQPCPKQTTCSYKSEQSYRQSSVVCPAICLQGTTSALGDDGSGRSRARVCVDTARESNHAHPHNLFGCGDSFLCLMS